MVLLTILAGAILLDAATTISRTGARTAIPVMFVVVLLAVFTRGTVTWRKLLGFIVVVILFVPIKKYALPASLPVHLELYRVTVALVTAAWLTSCFVDPRIRVRSLGVIDVPLAAFIAAVMISEISNPARVSTVGADLVKAVLFFFSYVVVVYLIASTVETREDIDYLVGVLVRGGGIVAVFALIESNTGYNVFDHLHSILPMLSYAGSSLAGYSRGSHARVWGSSQHPIAMGAALTMLVPLALYRGFALGRKMDWFVAFLLVLGAAATISRTAIIMILVVGVVFAVVRPANVRRMWPALIPALLAVHLAAPGVLGSIQGAFFPKGGLVAQQAHQNVGSGRLATLWPALHNEFDPSPIFGEGFGTRITTPDDVVKQANGPILDDQWLGVLLETGLVGTLSLLWLFARFVRKLLREARRDETMRGWLLGATAASVAAYAVSMFFYDAFSFIQVTFLLFILMGLGCAAYRLPPTVVHGE